MQVQMNGPRYFCKGQLRDIDPAKPIVDGIDLRQIFRWSPAEFVEILANPLHADELPLLFVHLDQGQPVSRIEAVGDQLVFGDGSLPWVWFCNFATVRSHQGRRLGTHLLKYMMETADRLGFGIGAPPSRPGSLAAYRIMNMSESVPLRRQVIPIAVDSIALNLFKPWLAAPLVFVGNAMLAGHRFALRSLSGNRTTKVVECQSVDALPEELFAAALPAPIGFARSRAKWQWRWQRCQRMSDGDRAYTLLRLDDREGRCFGAAMLRKATFDRPGGIPVDNLPVVTVLDWILAAPKLASFKALTQACISAAVELRGEALEFATGDEDLMRCLKRSTFVSAGSYRLFVHCDSTLAERLGRTRQLYWEACHVEDNFTW